MQDGSHVETPAAEGSPGEATLPFVIVLVAVVAIVACTVLFGLAGLTAAMTVMTFLVLGIILYVTLGR